jgi:hypothetical protein
MSMEPRWKARDGNPVSIDEIKERLEEKKRKREEELVENKKGKFNVSDSVLT